MFSVDVMFALVTLMSLINQVSGTPYIPGGNTSAGTDCSGLASWVANAAVGRDPYSGRFHTGNEEAALLAEALVDAVFEWFGGYTPAELLTAFGLSTSDVVEYLTAVVRDAVVALRDSGALERALRAHLEPFYSSPSVREILA